MEEDPLFDAIEMAALAAIDRYGVQITYVGGGDGTVPFAYTAGLAARDHPELILLGGIRPDYAQVTLNDLAFRVLGGVTFTEGDRFSDVIQGYDVIIAGPASPVWDPLYPVSMAKALYGDRARGPLQVLYPDRQGRFPWDEGAETHYPLICPVPPH
jgi:hypothetical protein